MPILSVEKTKDLRNHLLNIIQYDGSISEESFLEAKKILDEITFPETADQYEGLISVLQLAKKNLNAFNLENHYNEVNKIFKTYIFANDSNQDTLAALLQSSDKPLFLKNLTNANELQGLELHNKCMNILYNSQFYNDSQEFSLKVQNIIEKELKDISTILDNLKLSIKELNVYVFEEISKNINKKLNKNNLPQDFSHILLALNAAKEEYKKDGDYLKWRNNSIQILQTLTNKPGIDTHQNIILHWIENILEFFNCKKLLQYFNKLFPTTERNFVNESITFFEKSNDTFDEDNCLPLMPKHPRYIRFSQSFSRIFHPNNEINLKEDNNDVDELVATEIVVGEIAAHPELPKGSVFFAESEVQQQDDDISKLEQTVMQLP